MLTCKIPVSLCTDMIGRVVSWLDLGSGVWMAVVDGDDSPGFDSLTGELSVNLGSMSSRLMIMLGVLRYYKVINDKMHETDERSIYLSFSE